MGKMVKPRIHYLRAVDAIRAMELAETSHDRHINKIDFSINVLLKLREKLMDNRYDAEARASAASRIMIGTLKEHARLAKSGKKLSSYAMGDLDNAFNRASKELRVRRPIEEAVDKVIAVVSAYLSPPPPGDTERAIHIENMIRIHAMGISVDRIVAEAEGSATGANKILSERASTVLDDIKVVAGPSTFDRAKKNVSLLCRVLEELNAVSKGRPRSGGKRIPSAVAEGSLAKFMLAIGLGAGPAGLRKRRQRATRPRK